MLLDDSGKGRLALGQRFDVGFGCCFVVRTIRRARGIKRDRGGVRDVEALDRVGDRQPRKRIAMLARVGPQARSLRRRAPVRPAAGPSASFSSVSASPVRPMRQNPASPISSSARARLTTRAHGTRSSAPDAALATTPLSGGEWRSWVTMPTAPKAAAERRIAPTLCGSVTWSSTSSTARSGTLRSADRRATLPRAARPR